MSKIYVIARREFWAAVASKAFIISIVLMPIMMLGSLAFQLLVEYVKPSEVRTLAIIDRTPGEATKSLETMEALVEMSKPEETEASKKKRQITIKFVRVAPSASDAESVLKQRVEVADRVRKKEFSGFFDISADALKMPAKDAPAKEDVVYYTDRNLDREVQGSAFMWVLMAVNIQKAAFLNPTLFLKGRTSYQPKELAALILEAGKSTGRSLPIKDLPHLDTKTNTLVDGKEAKIVENIIVPLILIMLMFMVIMAGAAPLLQAVIEEKMQRIAEVLLGSARPFEILMGKLLGMTAVGLLLSAVYLSGGSFIAMRFDAARFLRPDLLIWFILFQSLALLMFGSIFLGVGSAVSDLKQSQSLMSPLMIVLVLPLMVIMTVIEDPSSTISRTLSFIPTATPMIMLARVALQADLPLWEPLLGMLIMLVTTVAVVFLAGRVFRIGYLSQGQMPKMGELVRWMVRGE